MIWRRDEVPMAERRPLLLQALNRLYEGKGGRAGRDQGCGYEDR